MKHRLCYDPVLTLPNLQQPFQINRDSSDYAIGEVLTQQGNLVAYPNETLSDTVRKYPTYDKEMYSILQACRQWKHYILGKETMGLQQWYISNLQCFFHRCQEHIQT